MHTETSCLPFLGCNLGASRRYPAAHMDVRGHGLLVRDLLDIWVTIYPTSVGLAIWIWCGSKADFGSLRAVSRKSRDHVFVKCWECDVRFDPEYRISIPKYCADVHEIIYYNDRCFEHRKRWFRTWYNFLVERARDRRPARTDESVPEQQYLEDAVWLGFGICHRRRCLCSLCNRLRQERRLL